MDEEDHITVCLLRHLRIPLAKGLANRVANAEERVAEFPVMVAPCLVQRGSHGVDQLWRAWA